MSAIRTLIVDDEALARRRCRRLLDDFPDVSVIGEAEDGSKAVVAIQTERPDLVLLDVQMPDLNGFDVLRTVVVPTLPMVIFVTAYDEHALEAFDVAAIDYLLKPVRRGRLAEALDRVRDHRASQKQLGRRLLRFLDDAAPSPSDYLRRLPVHRGENILVVPVADVAGLRIDRGLVYVTTAGGVFWTKYTTLSQIEKLLDPTTFVRVHRQHIVNLDHVREVTALDNATARLKLSTGHLVSVSRSHLRELKTLLDL